MVEIIVHEPPKKDESRFGNNFIAHSIRMTVSAYCREGAFGVDSIFGIHSEMPIDVLDVILLYYAKPMNLRVRYEEREEAMSVCPVLDSWNDINRRLANVFSDGKFNVDPNDCILVWIDIDAQDFGNISAQNWCIFRWKEDTDVMTWVPRKL